jgi:hypothetical protein
MKKTDVNSIKKLDEYYNKTRKMKFDSNEKIESIEDVYYTLYAQKIEDNDVTRTVFKYAPATYYKNGTQQCVASKYRSLDDFIKICKCYFPEKPAKEFYLFLLNEEIRLIKEENKYFVFSRCPAIRKYNIRGLTSLVAFDRIGKYNLRNQFTNLNMTLDTLL